MCLNPRKRFPVTLYTNNETPNQSGHIAAWPVAPQFDVYILQTSGSVQGNNIDIAKTVLEVVEGACAQRRNQTVWMHRRICVFSDRTSLIIGVM